ncbi:YhgE/Pip domain-containing protein [Gordonibacter urolithinfaciens]|uniref:YhgE/Pip domain-containing protein n=7 Tax=Gordonibacter urolithinfaciens TaxID=1335613 RepID=A0A6N8IJJ3_9ACTN|nr:YhgE/Pip domain-containing protein [Gordonibacter urolithinfaciens]MVN15570.1 YhgE/Pip domain-containing protein [Gordonibacter urolithinfaciens]MVN55547.1 YhgE/Pip domain-containing protein [Gordonibacter urolithinfaciens]
MAFEGVRFASLEWRNLAASKVMWVVIAAIAVIPLLYGGLYLAAFQDPYGRLSSLPVAVANEDAGAVIAAEQRNLGDEVVDELKRTDNGLGWHFVSADEARAGLADGTYFMACIIPSDFSASVASVDGDAPRRAQLKVEYNESENMLASQIGQTVWRRVRTRVSDMVAEQYWTTVLGRVADSGKQIGAAAAGARDLEGGLSAAQDGTRSIATNLGTLKNGAVALDAGLGTLAGGAVALDAGLGTLVGGTGALEAGAGSLASGASRVSDGASELRDEGGASLAAGARELADETAGLPAQAARLDDGVQAVVGSVGELSAALGTDSEPQTLVGGSAALASGLEELADPQTGAPALAQGVGELSGALKAADAASELSAGARTLYEGLVRTRDELASQASDLQALSAGAAALAQAAPSLVGGIDRLSAGAQDVSANLSVLAAGVADAASGAARLDAGAAEVASGARSAKDGAGELAQGAQSAQGGARQLATGAGQLREGTDRLVTGLHEATEGEGELASKLAAGAEEAADQTRNIPAKAEAMSDPVELGNDYYTSVRNYGTGFAPYFMALGLWVGSLVSGFVFKPLNGRLLLAGANPVTAAFANYLPMAAFALVQAALLMVVIQFGLQLQIGNVPAFWGMGFLTALVFAALMQLLLAAFGFPGRFLAIILLMLQLTTSAGTFPIQTTPAFFQAVSPYLPMTYVVEALRQIMTGLDYGVVGFDCLVLAGFGAAAFALTSIVAWRKRTVRMQDLHPVLKLG